MSKNRRSKLQLVSVEQSGPAGKVAHDSRGNAVWDWDIETGVLARKSVSELLSSLDAPGALSIDGEADRTNDWAGDPYNRAIR
jgi:hypothetical protein